MTIIGILCPYCSVRFYADADWTNCPVCGAPRAEIEQGAIQ